MATPRQTGGVSLPGIVGGWVGMFWGGWLRFQGKQLLPVGPVLDQIFEEEIRVAQTTTVSPISIAPPCFRSTSQPHEANNNKLSKRGQFCRGWQRVHRSYLGCLRRGMSTKSHGGVLGSS